MEMGSLFEEIGVEEFYVEEELLPSVPETVTVSLSDDETPEFLKAA